jgi:hypothetical protein
VSPWDGSSRSAQWLCGQLYATGLQTELARRLLDRGIGDASVPADAMAGAARASAAIHAGLSGLAPGPGSWFEDFMATQTHIQSGDRARQ